MTRARKKFNCSKCMKDFYVIFDAENPRIAMAEVSCPRPECGRGSVRVELPHDYHAEPAVTGANRRP